MHRETNHRSTQTQYAHDSGQQTLFWFARSLLNILVFTAIAGSIRLVPTLFNSSDQIELQRYVLILEASINAFFIFTVVVVSIVAGLVQGPWAEVSGVLRRAKRDLSFQLGLLLLFAIFISGLVGRHQLLNKLSDGGAAFLLLLILVSTFAAVSGGYRAYVVNVAMSASEYESYGSKTGFERWRLRLLRFRSRFPFTEAAVLRRSGSIPDGVLNPRRLRISASLAISALGTPILAIVLANAATTRLGADQLFPLFLAIAIGCINMLLATMIRISDLIKPYGKQGQMLPSADLLVKAEDAPKNI